jgi:predicted alpha/beta-hydrolase family hydrolase
MTETFVVDISSGTVSATDYVVAEPWAWCLLAHGAGAPQSSTFIVTTARLLAAQGVRTITFNFPYMEAKRRLPDRAPQLEACFGRVIAAGRARVGDELPLFLAGKSMGGRMATHLASQSRTPDAGRLDGVVCLGYPLHPPGRPEQLRNQHLPRIRVPMFFLQGTRDSFGQPDEIRAAFPVMPDGSALREVTDADHTFNSPSQARATEEQRLTPLIADIVSWMRGVSTPAVGRQPLPTTNDQRPTTNDQ